MKREEKEVLYNFLDTARCWAEGFGLPKPAPVTFVDDTTVPPIITTADTLEIISEEIAACGRCGLAATRNFAVPGEGADNPLVLIIGEGPGAEEDNTGHAFIGEAGKLLDKMLAAIDLSRKTNTHILNIVKCRPPGNRDPNPDEISLCLPYLHRQIDLLNPVAILTLGRVALTSLVNTSDGIGKVHGQFFEYRGYPLMPTYHPSALLRNEEYKRPAWEDLKKLRAWINSTVPPNDPRLGTL